MKIAKLSVTPIHPERWGCDLDVVNAARVSFAKVSTALTPEDIKLIQYLAKHKHFSPFNHSFLSFRIKAPIFTARQFVKHKFMPWNEVSRRYVDDTPEFYLEPNEWRMRSKSVKQGSQDAFIHEEHSMEVQGDVEESIDAALTAYTNMLSYGVAPEQARMILPQNTMTEWIWSGTLGAFLDMLVLRLDKHTQKETRDVAQMIAVHVQKAFPVSFEARIYQ